MSKADDYAQWIVDNQDKKGTADFDTVAKAYQEAKAEEAGTIATNNNITTAPPEGTENVATYAAQSAVPLTVGGPNLMNAPVQVGGAAIEAGGPLTRTAVEVAKDVPAWVKPLSNLSVGETLKYVGQHGLTKSAADLAGAILHPLRDVSLGTAAKAAGTGIVQGVMAPENLMTLPYNMAAYEQAKIRANPNAPEYASNPYAMTVRGEAPTQAAAGAINQRLALMGQKYGGITPEQQQILQKDRERQQAQMVLKQPPNTQNYMQRMKALSELYSPVTQP